MIRLNVGHPATGEYGWDRMEVNYNEMPYDDYIKKIESSAEDSGWRLWKKYSDGRSVYYKPHGVYWNGWSDDSVLTNEQILHRKSTVTSSYQIGYFSKGQFWANAVVGDLNEAIEKKKWADEHFQMENRIVMVTSGVAYTEMKFEEKSQVDPV